jgi:hypothetical protein
VPAKIIKPSKKAEAEKVFGKNGVLFSFPQGEDGPVQIKINFASAPEPLQYYYADSVYVGADDELLMAILSFGRREANTNKFSDRIEIVMPAKALFVQFWSSARSVEGTVDKYLQGIGTGPKARSISAPETPPAATLFANVIFVAVGEGESVFDFYQLSAREVHFAKTQKKEMHVQPVIRVFVSTILLKHFFTILRPHAQEPTNVQAVEGGNIRATGRPR